MNMDQNLYECSVCLGPFTKPKLIGCHHTFCLCCLEDLVDHNSSKIYIRCPLCNKSSKIPEGGVVNFTTNIRCPLCNKSSKIPEGGVVNFTTNFYIEKPANYRSDKMLCKNHPEIIADSYCKDCKFVLCSKCILRNHKDHTFLDLESEESTNQIVEEFSRRKENMEAMVEEFQIFQTILDDKSCELDDFATNTIKDVQRHVENLCAMIKDMGSNVVQSIEENLDDNKYKVKKLCKEVEIRNTNMTQKVREMEKYLKHQKTGKIIEAMANLEDSTKSSSESSQAKFSHPDISCLSFVESQNKIDMNIIGTLVPVQSPLMVTGFEELLGDHKVEEVRSTLSSESDCLLYPDEPEINFLTSLTQTDKPITGYAEIVVSVKDIEFYKQPVINGVTWGITTKRLGCMLCVYLDQPIEGNSNIHYSNVDCQLSIENKESDFTIRRQVENRQFEPGGDENVRLEVSWPTISDPHKNYIVNDLLTVGIFIKYKTIKYHKR